VLVHLIALTLTATPAPKPPHAPKPPRCVQVIGTNDVHGHLEPEETRAGAFSTTRGGLAGFGGYLNLLRQKYPGQVLLVDGGDLFQGTVPSNLSKGAAVIAAYNQLGYAATAMGNHEFDFGPEGAEKDLLGAIKARLAEAKFPFLACNMFEAKTGKFPEWKNLKASTLVTVNGVKVGLIGAITPETPLVTVPKHVESLEFKDPGPLVAKEARALRKQGAAIVVLMAHIGGDCKSTTTPDDLSSCNMNSEMFKLMDGLPRGTVDVAIAGHTHKYIAQRVDGVAVSEAGYYGHSFGWVEACVDGKGAVTTSLHAPQDICLTTWAEGGCGAQDKATGAAPATFLGAPLVPDEGVQKAIAPFLERVKVAQEAKVGIQVATVVPRSHDRLSPLGKLVAEGIRHSVPGAQIGLTNAGGVRAELPAGDLVFRQVFEVLPFDNRVTVLKLTGAELKSFVLAPLAAGHGFPQLAGAKLIIDDAQAKVAHLELEDGAAVKDDQTYVLATNDFLANGGDGTKAVIEKVPKERREDLPLLIRDAFINYLKTAAQPIQPPTCDPAQVP
jgi:5'-nucleotidase